MTGHELRINARVLACRQVDVLALDRLEAGDHDAHRILTWIQVGRDVFSGLVGDQSSCYTRLRVRHRDIGAADHRAGLIGNGS